MTTEYRVFTAGNAELSDEAKTLARACCLREHKTQRKRPWLLILVLWPVCLLVAFATVQGEDVHWAVQFFGLSGLLIPVVVTYFVVNGPRLFFSREPLLVRGKVTEITTVKNSKMLHLTAETTWRGPFSPWPFTEITGDTEPGYWLTKTSVLPSVGERVLVVSEGVNTATVIGRGDYLVDYSQHNQVA